MIVHIDKYGRAYTEEKDTAMKYRVKDTQIQYHRIKKWLPEYDKYVPLYYYDKKTKIYRLPPRLGKGEIHCGIEHISWDYYTDSQIICALNPGQTEAVLKTIGLERAKIICGSPSIGKSFILWTLASHKNYKSIVVAPTNTIADWLYEKFTTKICNDSSLVLRADANKIKKDPNILNKYTVIIITRASLYNVRDIVNDYDKYKFDQFLFDEAHLLWPTMQMMINTFKGKWIVWVTATPRRKELTDEQFEMFFNEKITIEGRVLPVKVLEYSFKYDMPIKEYINITKDCKDPTAPEVLRTMTNNCEKRINFIKDITSERLINQRIVLLLVDRIEEINRYKEFFPNAILIWGWNKDEDILIKALEDIQSKPSRRILIIWTAQSCWTGFDYPAIRSVVMSFSTRRRNSIEQYAGRSRRSWWDKTYWELCDIQDKWRINNQYRYFGSKERKEIYKELWYEEIEKELWSNWYDYFIKYKERNEGKDKRYC